MHIKLNIKTSLKVRRQNKYMIYNRDYSLKISISQVFSNYFASVYALDTNICDTESLSLPFYYIINSCYFEFCGFVGLRGNMTVGPDGLFGDFLYGNRPPTLSSSEIIESVMSNFDPKWI